jgi:hypothetical protein
MHLVAVSHRALRDIGGEFRVKLGRQFQPAEVRPEVFVANGQAMIGIRSRARSESSSENNGHS